MKQVSKNILLVGATIVVTLGAVVLSEKLRTRPYDPEIDDLWDDEDFDEPFFDEDLDPDFRTEPYDSASAGPVERVDIHVHLKGEDDE